jgi:hypothetical protein
LAITGKEGLTNATLPGGTYNDNSESQTVIRSPLIDARGLSLVSLKFDYTVQGEVDPTAGSTDIENLPVFDYMAVAYSLDGVKFVELNTDGFKQFASAAPASGTFNGLLPVSLSNKQFYLAFRWSNDANGGGPVSVKVDNLLIQGSPIKIENSINEYGRETLNKGQNVYFYSIKDHELLGKVKNNSTNNFGCTNMFVEKTGTSAFNLYQGNDGLQKVADKIVRIEPAVTYNASTTVTLYYTEAQLQALESATGKSRTSFSIYLVNAAAYSSASSKNTTKYAATYTPISGVGGSYTITFTNKANGSYALGATVSVAGSGAITLARPIVLGNSDEWKFSNIYPNPGNGDAILPIVAPHAEQIKIDVVNIHGQLIESKQTLVPAGNSQILLQLKRLTSGAYMINVKNKTGEMINSQQYNRQ